MPFAGLLELLRPVLGHLDAPARAAGGRLRSALALGPGRERRAPRDRRRDARHPRRRRRGRAAVRARRRRAVARSGRPPRRCCSPPGACSPIPSRSSSPSAPDEASPLADAGLPALELLGLDLDACEALLAARARRAGARWQRRAAAPRDRRQSPRADRARRRGRGRRGQPGRGAAADRNDRRARVRRPRRAPLRAGAALAARGRRRLDTPIVGLLAAPADCSTSTSRALQEAEAAGLVAIADGVASLPASARPLRRAQRRRARRAARGARRLARTLGDERHADERAWHLGLAAFGPDDDGRRCPRAARRRGRASAAPTPRRAGRPSAPRGSRSADAVRGRRLLEAASNAWIAGSGEHAVSLLDEVGAARRRRRRRNRQRLPARARRVRTRRRDAGARRLRQLRRGSPSHDGAGPRCCGPRRRTRRSPPGAWTRCSRTRAPRAPRCRRATTRAARPARHGSRSAWRSCSAARTTRARARCAPRSGWSPTDAAAGRPAAARGAGRSRRRSSCARRARRASRSRARIAVCPRARRRRRALAARSTCTRATPRRPIAGPRRAPGYYEAAELAHHTGQPGEECAAFSGLAWLEAREGREESCRAHAADALALAREYGRGFYEAWALAALGDLELALGRPAEAVDRLSDDAGDPRAPGHRRRRPVAAPELAEALVQCGRGSDADRGLRRLPPARGRQGPAVGARPAARAEGLVADDDGVPGLVRGGAALARVDARHVRARAERAGLRRASAPRRAGAATRASTCARPSRPSTSSAPSRGPSAPGSSSPRRARRRASAIRARSTSSRRASCRSRSTSPRD